MLFLLWPKGYQEPCKEAESLSPAKCISGIPTKNLLIMSVTHYPTVLLSLNIASKLPLKNTLKNFIKNFRKILRNDESWSLIVTPVQFSVSKVLVNIISQPKASLHFSDLWQHILHSVLTKWLMRLYSFTLSIRERSNIQIHHFL